MIEYILAELTDNIFTLQLVETAPCTYAMRIKIAMSEFETRCWEYPITEEIEQCLIGASIEPYTVSPMDNVFVWVGAEDGNLRLAFSVQEDRYAIVDPDDHTTYVVGTDDWVTDAEIVISRMVLSAVAMQDVMPVSTAPCGCHCSN